MGYDLARILRARTYAKQILDDQREWVHYIFVPRHTIPYIPTVSGFSGSGSVSASRCATIMASLRYSPSETSPVSPAKNEPSNASVWD